MSSGKKQNKKTTISATEVTAAAAGAGPLYFYEDEIYRIAKSGETEFGMVTENWEMYSSESEESDEDHESDKVPKGHVAVTWHPSGKEGVIPESKVQLSDRSLMPGDVVRRLISGKDTQRGYARKVKVRAVVQTIGSKEVFPNVPATSLNPVQKYPSDVAVYMDCWIGSVRDMRYKLTLRFSDKSICVADSYTIAEYFDDVRPAAGGFRNGDTFYPGQKLQGSLRYLRNAEWAFMSEDMKRAKDRKQVTGVVNRVELVGVSVQWQYPTPISPLEQEMIQKQKAENENEVAKSESKDEKAEGGDEEKVETEKDWERKKPGDFITGEDIKRLKTLNLFDSCTVQLGDISFYVPPANETPFDKKTWKKVKNAHLWSWALKDKLPGSKMEEEEYSSTENEAEETACSKNETGNGNQPNNKKESSTTVVSGTTSGKKNLPKLCTRSLRKKKLKKSRQAATVTDPASKETQFVVETIHTSSMVDVVWQDGTIEEGVRSVDLYPIHHLDDNEFFPGDFIVRADSTDPNTYGVIQNMDHNGRVANVKWFEVYTTGGDHPKELKVEEVSVYDIKDHPDFRFRPGTVVFRIANFQPNQVSGGQVLDNYPDGQIRVWWANNVEQQCWPQDLYRIGDYDSDEGELWDNGGEDDPASEDSWCTTDEEEDEDKNESPSRKKSPSGLKTSEKVSDSNDDGVSPQQEVSTGEEVSEPQTAPTPSGNSNEASDTVASVPSTPDIPSIVRKEPIPQFSMLGAVPTSHRFYSSTFQPSNAKSFLKTIQKELSLLRNNLPSGILVKGFEDRMDLYSVMIHGPKNTPYEDGIFCFDIQLPGSYPDLPPLVHYVSFCQSRLNPNLYECGKVCVSLLGTWTGKGNETWTSGSSVLQLLISIQGLILVPEPYYNEAGYERQRGSQQGEENSRMYNEMVLIKLVQSMTRMMNHPHAPWVSETTQHIESRGLMMVERYKSWLLESETAMHATGGGMPGNGGKCKMCGKENPGFPLFPVSKGFAISLKKTLDSFVKCSIQEENQGGNPPVGSSMDVEVCSGTAPNLIQSLQGEGEVPGEVNDASEVTGMETEEVQDAYIIGEEAEGEGTELVQFLDEESVAVEEGVQEEAVVVSEEGELVEIIEGDEFGTYEEGELVAEENSTEEFLPTDTELSHGEVIDESQIVETVIDDRSGTFKDDDDKENGDSNLQAEYTDDADTDTEQIVEITRRRLSHEGNCYCGKDRNLNIVELLCASCHRWYHESCIGYQLGKLVPFMMNYVFICKNCSPTGLESFKRAQAQFAQMCVTAIANLTQASVKDNSNRQRFSKDADIIPFIDMHWEGMTPTRRLNQSWHSAVSRTLMKESNSLFTIDDDPTDSKSPYFGLLALDLTQIRPNYEAMINSGSLKLSDLNSSGQFFRRGSGKRRTVSGIDIYAQSQASVAKKSKGDSSLAKSILGHGYPNEHPFNKDGYRYVLAEPDSNAPFRQEFDESSDWAGKPIPGWLYRVLNPPFVFLALHDRAPQLKVSEDRLSVSGEKGYCMIRASHFVTKGSWYWEAKITELPESAACRIGWGQAYANLQAPLGFDKFGYSWRSRLGTKFHQACGKTYCPGGFTLGDVLGFLIVLPEPESHVKTVFAATDPPSVPESFKDRPLVRFKSHLYYEDKDISAEVEVNESRSGSKIICFKNGVCQGVAYENIFEGSYYPAVSLYKGCTVKVNFGPKFEYPPAQQKYKYKAFQERAEDAIIEQTMSDILFLTENHGKLSLDNVVPVPS